MFAILKRNPLALIFALALHGLLAFFLIVGVDWDEKPKPVGAKATIVQASVVSQKDLLQEVAKLKKADTDKKSRELAQKKAKEKELADLKKRREAEKKKLAKLEKNRKQREKDELKKRQQAKLKVDAEKKNLANLIKEQRRLKAQKKKRLEKEKQQKAEAEKKRLAEERLKQQKIKEVARKKDAAEKKRLAGIAAKKKAEALKKQQEAVAREQELASQFEADQDATEKQRVIGAIISKIERNWLQPLGTAGTGLTCKLKVRLGSSGSVLLANVVKSSGNEAFDRSVETAVHKASPLPMPSSERLKATFKNIEFIFDPDN